jgi:hypothetical protein
LTSKLVTIQRKLVAKEREQSPVSEAPGPSASRISSSTAKYEDNLTTEELEELELQSFLLEEAKAQMVNRTGQKPGTSGQCPNLEDIQSSHGSDKTITNNYRPDLLVRDDGAPEAAVEPTKLDKGKGKEPETNTVNDMFAKRPVRSIPTTSTTAITGGLAHSKSQLTLLLEKDRARNKQK